MVYAKQVEQVDASVFNLWRRARLRFGSPQRIDLSELKHISLILKDEQWVVVHQGQNDMPLIGWEFSQIPSLDSIHEPVHCTFNYYHFMAHYMGGQLKEKVLEQMKASLELRLETIT